MKIYLSHPIRGLERNVGRTRELEIMDENNKKACMAAAMIRAARPDLEVYCPAEHEEMVAGAYFSGMLSEAQILTLDCNIISTCDLVLFFNHQGKMSHGMEVEFMHAEQGNIERVTVQGWHQLAQFILTYKVDGVLHGQL